MLRFVENPTWDYVIGAGEAINLKIKSYDAVFFKGHQNEHGDCPIYLCMGEILSGNTPNIDYREFLCSEMGWDRCYGWRFPRQERTLSEWMEWFVGDNNDFSDLDESDIEVVASTGILTSSTIERKEFVLKDYTDTMYTGLHSYHHSHSVEMNTPKKEMKAGAYRIGVELEIEAKSSRHRTNINKVRSNWFFQETDSSLRDGRGIEIVTIPLLPKDAMSVDTWAPLVEYLKPIAESYSSSNCGLHIHIGREALGKDEDDRQATLGKLLYFYYECLKPLDWNNTVFGRRRTYSENDFRCKESEAVKVLGMDLMADKKIREKVDKGLKDTAALTRYYDINIQNAPTIEFRKGKGSICTERIIAVITYCDLMIRYCRKRDWMDMNADDFLAYIRKTASKSSPIFRYLPTSGEEA